MKLKWFSKKRFQKFCQQQNHLPDGQKYIKVAQTWADMMEARLTQKRRVVDIKPQNLFKKIEDYMLIRFSEFEKAFIVSILLRYWKHGRQLKQWYAVQNDFSRTVIFLKV